MTFSITGMTAITGVNAARHIQDYQTRKIKQYKDIGAIVSVCLGTIACFSTLALSSNLIGLAHNLRFTDYSRVFTPTLWDIWKHRLSEINLASGGLFPGYLVGGVSYTIIQKVMLRSLEPLQEFGKKLNNANPLTSDELKVLIQGVDSEQRKLIEAELSQQQRQALLKSLSVKELKSSLFRTLIDFEIVKKVTLQNLHTYKEILLKDSWFIRLLEAHGDRKIIKAAYQLILSVHLPQQSEDNAIRANLFKDDTLLQDEFPPNLPHHIKELNLPSEFMDLLQGKNVPLSKELVLRCIPDADKFDIKNMLALFDLYIAVHYDQFSKEELVNIIPHLMRYRGRPDLDEELNRDLERILPKSFRLLKNDASNPIWAKRPVKALHQSLVSENAQKIFKWITISSLALGLFAAFFPVSVVASAFLVTNIGVTKFALTVSCVINLWGLLIQLENRTA